MRLGPTPVAQALGDRHVVGVAAAEIEAQHRGEVLGQAGCPSGLARVSQQRLVVAVVLHPLRDRLGRRLLAERAARDVLGRRVQEEEREQEEQHAEHRRGAAHGVRRSR